MHDVPDQLSRTRLVAEKTLNLMLGGTVAWWTVVGLMAATAWAPVHLAIGGLNFTVAALFVTREPEHRAAPWAALAWALPAVLAGGVALKLAADPGLWPWYAQALYALGAVGAAFSLLTLGRSFAVLPGVRSLVDGGPYRFIRHPAYLAQLLMVIGCAVVLAGPVGIALLVAAVVTLVVRIRAEEAVLSEDEGYRAYVRRVPWRMVPGLW